MRSEKKKEEKIERKNLLNALWFVGLTKGGQFEVWHLERFHIVINFYSTRSQKGSSLQEKVLSVCLFVCPSSLFPFPNIFLFFLLRSSSPPLTNFEVWHLERFNMIGQQFLLDPFTKGVESTRENSNCLSVCLSVITSSFFSSFSFSVGFLLP